MNSIETASIPYLLALIVVLGFSLKVNFNKTDSEVGWAYLILITRAAFTSFATHDESPDWLLPIVNNLEFRTVLYLAVIGLLVYKTGLAIKERIITWNKSRPN